MSVVSRDQCFEVRMPCWVSAFFRCSFEARAGVGLRINTDIQGVHAVDFTDSTLRRTAPIPKRGKNRGTKWRVGKW